MKSITYRVAGPIASDHMTCQGGYSEQMGVHLIQSLKLHVWKRYIKLYNLKSS